jgi:HK97 family phage major capsid protein
MFNPTKAKQDRAYLLARMDELLAAAEKRDSKSLTDAEAREFDAAEREARALSAQIEAAESRFQRPTFDPLATLPGVIDTRSTRGPFHTLGEFAQAVARACTPGNPTDQRLHEIRENRAALGLHEGVGSEGGFLVQSDFSTMLLDRAFGGSKVVSLATRIPIREGANTVELPAIDETSRKDGYRTGGIQSYWLDEAGAKTPTKPAFRKVVLSPKKLVGLCYATDELLQDAEALGNFLTRAFAAEFAFRLDDAAIRGTGAAEPLGILNAPCTITQSKETGQAAATFTYANALAMWSRCLNPETATWFVHKSVLPQLYAMTLIGGTSSQPVFIPAGGASQRPYDALFGRPVVVIEQASVLGTRGDVILASMDRYLVAQKGPMQAAQSIHVAYLTDQVCFRFVLRVDMAPELASAVTPAQGSTTESCFVTLETRS